MQTVQRRNSSAFRQMCTRICVYLCQENIPFNLLDIFLQFIKIPDTLIHTTITITNQQMQYMNTTQHNTTQNLQKSDDTFHHTQIHSRNVIHVN